MERPDDLFRSLIKESGLPLKLFAKATKTSANETLQWWSGDQNINLSDDQKNSFQDYFAIPVESVLNNETNVDLLRKRIHGPITSLPECYEDNANSFVRSSFYIIKYLRMLYGQEFADKVLTSLEVHPGYFSDLNQKINIRFVINLLNRCKTFGFKQNDFKALANSMFLSVENTPIEDLFADVRNYEEFYQQFEILTKFFDENFTYEFSVSRTGAEFITRPSEKLEEFIRNNKEETDILFKYRPLLFSQGPLIKHMAPLDLEIQSCISQGDNLCRYRVNFSDSHLRVL